jgi:thiol:disulfide interchange protein DsbD
MALPRLVSWSLALLGLGFAVTQLGLSARDASLADWRGVSEYPSAVAEARDSGRPLALLFYTEWCSACKELRRSVLAAPEVKRYLQDFVRVKVDLDGGSAARALAERFGVLGVPTLFVIPPRPATSRPIAIRTGLTPSGFIAACRQVSG